MSDFMQSLTSASWWIGVVVVGIAINLVSAYTKPRLDRMMSRTSKWWASLSQTRRDARESRVVALVGNPSEQILATLAEMRMRVRSVFFLILSLGIITIAFLVGPGNSRFAVGMFIGTVCIVTSLATHAAAMAQGGEVFEARERDDVAQQPPARDK